MSYPVADEPAAFHDLFGPSPKDGLWTFVFLVDGVAHHTRVDPERLRALIEHAEPFLKPDSTLRALAGLPPVGFPLGPWRIEYDKPDGPVTAGEIRAIAWLDAEGRLPSDGKLTPAHLATLLGCLGALRGGAPCAQCLGYDSEQEMATEIAGTPKLNESDFQPHGEPFPLPEGTEEKLERLLALAKPCPSPRCRSEDLWFLGCEPGLVAPRGDAQIECKDCEARGPVAETFSEALECWNELPRIEAK